MGIMNIGASELQLWEYKRRGIKDEQNDDLTAVLLFWGRTLHIGSPGHPLMDFAFSTK